MRSNNITSNLNKVCSFISAIYLKNLNALKISSLARNGHDAQHKGFDSDSRNEIGTKKLIKLHLISIHIKVQKIGKELNKFIARLCFDYVQIVEINTLIKRFKGTTYFPIYCNV